jgi:hypothetical protein
MEVTTDNFYEIYPELLEYYRKNPLAWYYERWEGKVENILWSLREEYQDHKWDSDKSDSKNNVIVKDPLAEAWLALSEGYNVAVQSATSTGKTYLGSLIALWFLDVYPGGSVFCFGASLGSFGVTFWPELKARKSKFLEIRPKAKFYTSPKIEMDPYSGDSELTAKWTLVGRGARVRTNEDSNIVVQGMHNKDMLIILDELPGIAPSVMTAIKNTCVAENNIILGLGNPDRETDSLGQFTKLPHVVSIRISAYDHPNVVLGREEIPGAVTKSSILKRKNDYPESSPFFKSRVRGICPSAGEKSLFDMDAFEKAYGLVPDHDGHYPSAGVDVANSIEGDSGSVSIIETNVVQEIVSFRCPDASFLAYNLVFDKDRLWRLISEYSGPIEPELLDYGIDGIIKKYGIIDADISVDGVGVGASTINTFYQIPEYSGVFNFIGGESPNQMLLVKQTVQDPRTGQFTQRPVLRFGNIRSQAYYQLAYDISKGYLGFNSDNISRETFEKLKMQASVIDLADPKVSSSAQRIIRVESKNAIRQKLVTGESPNELDSLAYANFTRWLNFGGSFFRDYDNYGGTDI